MMDLNTTIIESQPRRTLLQPRTPIVKTPTQAPYGPGLEAGPWPSERLPSLLFGPYSLVARASGDADSLRSRVWS